MNLPSALLSTFLISSSVFCFPTSSIDLSLEEKIGQLLMVHVQGEEANEEARAFIQDLKVGGIIYYNWANGLTSFEQVQHLSQGLNKMAEETPHAIPLLIAADQEGGIVARMKNGYTEFPGNRALGQTGKPQLAEEAAYLMGLELLASGVNMNLAPVVDVNSEPRNPIIGIRSFGDKPQTVSDFAEHALKGYHRAGVITTLKHFPGHGDTQTDSHEGLPKILHAMDRLEKVELFPFAKLSSQTDAVMTAHIVVPALDPTTCSTLSKPTLDYLRKTIGFQGVIIADSLVMEGVLKKTGTVDEAAIGALSAGCDILLLGGKQLHASGQNIELSFSDVKRIQQALIDAVLSGRIPEKRVDESVDRLLALKNKYANVTKQPAGRLIDNQLPKKIARLALETTIDTSIWPKNWQNLKILVIAPEILSSDMAKTSFGSFENSLFYPGLNPSKEFVEKAILKAKEADGVLFLSYNAWKNPDQEALLKELSAQKKPLGLICLRDPLDLTLVQGLGFKMATYSPSRVSLEEAFQRITQE